MTTFFRFVVISNQLRFCDDMYEVWLIVMTSIGSDFVEAFYTLTFVKACIATICDVHQLRFVMPSIGLDLS